MDYLFDSQDILFNPERDNEGAPSAHFIYQLLIILKWFFGGATLIEFVYLRPVWLLRLLPFIVPLIMAIGLIWLIESEHTNKINN